jgi:hypothetical protein
MNHATSTIFPAAATASATLHIVLRADAGGPILAREAVREADLADVKSELWMAAALRRGRPDLSLESMPYRVVPRIADGENDVVSSYRLETTAATGESLGLAFTPSSLEPVAMRVAQRLLAEGTLSADTPLVWDVTATPGEAIEQVPTPVGDVIIREIPRAMDYMSVPIEVFRQDMRRLGGMTKPRDYPVFYAAEALIAASRHARRGGESPADAPPVESGAALLGVLCSCPRTGEFFAVVIAAEPIEHAEETRFSLTLSAASWDRIDARLDEMRRRYGDACRLLGQAHGHPFKPIDDVDLGTGKNQTASASCHTAHVSRDDIAWMRAVFAREPWQLCHIFGRDRAGKNVHALFGLRDGTLAWRGFSVICNFRPEMLASV